MSFDLPTGLDELESALLQGESLITPLRKVLSWLSVGGSTSPERRDIWKERAQPIVLRILREPHEDAIHEVCWNIVTHAIHLSSYVSDDPSKEDQETMNSIVQAGLLDVLLVELQRQPRSHEVLSYCLITATNLGLYERLIPVVLREGLCEKLLAIVQDVSMADSRNRLLALISLTNIALFPSSHSVLLRANALETAIGLLHHLQSSSNLDLDLGLTAGFLICRIAGRDEAGPGMQSIQDNRTLVDKLLWILEAVLNAGPNGIVLDSHWNPANIMLDVSILSQSDMNKPLLRQFIPLIARSLSEYGDLNRRLVKYSIVTLLELYQYEACRVEIHRHRLAFLSELRKKRPYFHDCPTFQGIQMLLALLDSASGSMRDTLFHMLRRLREGLPSITLNVNTAEDW